MVFKIFAPGRLYSAEVNDYLMEQANIVCTSTTRPSAPTLGMEIFETDTALALRYDGTAWRTWPPAPVENYDGTTQAGITSGTYAAGSPSVSLTFTGPPGGAVKITVGGSIEGGSGTGIARLSWEVRLTNVGGAIVNAAADSWGTSIQGTNQSTLFHPKILTGLTAGQLYFARTLHRADNGPTSVAVYSRRLIVEPLPNGGSTS